MNNPPQMDITATEAEVRSKLTAEQLLLVAKWLQEEGFDKFEECYSLKFIDALNYAAARLEGFAQEKEPSR